MAKYRKKPLVVEAFQWQPSMGAGNGVVLQQNQISYAVKTLIGEVPIFSGYWIITGAEGARYPCKADVFEANYAPETGHERRSTREQLEEVKDILIREGILTAEEVARDGVRFALKHKFEPEPKRAEKVIR
ncbi:hypothetical protein LCGC14_1352380 [marine sediment metagenome]|uniref:Uncharacterized protein n=1 Tax=marine sediment metagenome TaxID=412755 RepID=A0A0F9KB80_9ZZZZ